jgi:hypothetical protein
MNFIDYIEKLYETINIHRAIIIVNDNIEKLQKELSDKYHTPIIINQNSDINYDYRLFILSDINLLSKFIKNSYNLVIIY